MDKESTEAWKTWLKGIPVPEQKVLLELLRGFNGKPQTQLEIPSSDQLTIARTATEDLLIDEVPVFVDIFNLHAVYEQLAFESNLILKGPKGDGKTLSIFSWAHVKACPLVMQECSDETKKQELMGSQQMLGDRTLFILGSIPTAIEVANEMGQCILLFEELNALNPGVQKQLNAIADFRKMVSMPSIGKSYRLKKGAKLWLVATMNSSVYGGTYDLNEDLKSRFEEIEMTYPAHGQEKQVVKANCPNAPDDLIDNVIRFAKETRQQATGYALSIRDVVNFVKTSSRVGLDTTLQMIIGKFEDSDKDVVLKRMASVWGPKQIKKFWGAV